MFVAQLKHLKKEADGFMKHELRGKRKLKFKVRRKGYQHVGVEQEQELGQGQGQEMEEDGHSDASSGSDAVGHEYRGKDGKGAHCDALFFEDYVKHRLQLGAHAQQSGEGGSVGYLGSVLLWNLNVIVFQSMFDESMKVKQSFKANSAALKWKLFWYGVANLVLTPFSASVRVIFFFLENAEEMHSNRGRLFSFRCVAAPVRVFGICRVAKDSGRRWPS